MRQILEIEYHVVVAPMMYSDPFYRITYLIKEEIRKYKWIEGEKRPDALLARGQSRMDRITSKAVRNVPRRDLGVS